MRNKRWLKVALYLVISMLVLTLLNFVVYASSAILQSEPPAFNDFLEGASGPLIGSFAVVVISIILEFWPAFNELKPPNAKRYIYLGICLVISTSAASLRAMLRYVPWGWDSLLWPAIWNAFATFGVGTLTHPLWKQQPRA
jgi:hypothetical protein